LTLFNEGAATLYVGVDVMICVVGDILVNTPVVGEPVVGIKPGGAVVGF